MPDEQVVAERTVAGRSIWSRYRLEIQIVVLILVAWGPPIVDSISFYFGYTNGPITGSPRGIVGSCILLAFETLTVCALAFAWVKPKKMGLFLPRADRPRMRSWWKVFALATVIIFASMYLRYALADLGVPFNRVGSGGDGNPWWELPSAIRAGIYEEIPMAAMVVLMLRAKWKPINIVYLIGTLRMLFHFYQGGTSVVPTLLWGMGWTYLFIEYRRVGPIIAAHLVYDIYVVTEKLVQQ